MASYVKDCYDSIEVKYGENRIEWLRVRIREEGSKADILLGVSNRVKRNLKYCVIWHMRDVSLSLALVLAEDFSFSDIYWKYNTAEREPSQRFLERVEDNFLT